MTTDPTAAQQPLVLLSPEEEITLRRVAFGESPVRTLRAADLARLRRLRLIDDGRDGPRLTVSGRAHFDSLPKAAMLTERGPRNLTREVARALKPGRDGR